MQQTRRAAVADGTSANAQAARNLKTGNHLQVNGGGPLSPTRQMVNSPAAATASKTSQRRGNASVGARMTTSKKAVPSQ